MTLVLGFVDLIIDNGLPGSGHTSPDSPIFEFIKDYVSDEQYALVQAVLADAQIEDVSDSTPSTISELNAEQNSQESPNDSSQATDQREQSQSSLNIDYRWLFFLLVLFLIIGVVRGLRAPTQQSKRS